MDKRYQVFVSSTYEDLKDERLKVIQAILELNCIPAGMELFPASDEEKWALIKRMIDDSDYYLVILGGRYGSVSSDGISYTQKEYEYAANQRKPVMGFIHRNPDNIPFGKTERTQDGLAKLDAFKDIVKNKMCKQWSTADELGAVVSRSLISLIDSKPAVGWIRANLNNQTYFTGSKTISNAAEITFNEPRYIKLTCSFCEGTGIEPDTDYGDEIDPYPCEVCCGKGIIVVESSCELVECGCCDGTGRGWKDGYFFGDTCRACKGLGVQALVGELHLVK